MDRLWLDNDSIGPVLYGSKDVVSLLIVILWLSRFMWQVISEITHKRSECCVVLTTHSMEECEVRGAHITLKYHVLQDVMTFLTEAGG